MFVTRKQYYKQLNKALELRVTYFDDSNNVFKTHFPQMLLPNSRNA